MLLISLHDMKLECTLYYHRELLEALIDCGILVSPFNPTTMDGTVIRVDGDKAVELVLGRLMYLRECDMRVVEVPEEWWCEIDDADDLARARKKFSEQITP